LDLMQRAGRVPPGRRLTPRVARAFRAELRAYLEKRHQIGALRAELDADRDEIAALGVDIELLRSRILDVLGPALQPEPLPEDLSAALTMFERAAEKRERHDRIRSESLPTALRRHRVPPAVRAEELARDLEVLERRIEPLLRDNPAYAAITPRRSSREYAEERRRLVEEIRATQRERNALSEELGDVLKEYRRDYPGRQQLLVTLESALTRAMAFRDSVGIAAETLAAISREAYAEWAEVLNEKTSDIMRRLNPSYDDVRFDTDLTFTLRDTRGGVRRDQAEVDMHFSGGARDQIYLAIRMAVAEYLSSGGVRLPIVLDDPFAMFDDARFSRAMEFLLDTVARRHQIILLSCHEERHRRWQQEVPEHLADRVRLLDLTPLSA
ncbi:MAG TPA: hypothetical protein VFP98_04655, partial [Candidatus Polarisedimenticolia bacterium]|nr:hypothetical protein [Candidatus Polarisedimenticolia bacterium]